MNNDKEHELFKNIIIKPKEGDERTFEEYEKEMSYEFFRSIDGLVENLEEGRQYEVTGCNTDNGELSVLIYGYANDLNIPYVNNKPIADRVKMYGHKGFQILCTKSDERVFNSGETEDVWLKPFVRKIERTCCGSQYNSNGSLEKYRNGETKGNYLYDYVWMIVDKSNGAPFKWVMEDWMKITDNKHNYYILWINQEDRQ